jgi:hypothetical protein
MVVSAKGTPHGIVLTFSKPMDPVAASNPKNYAVHWTTEHGKYDSLGPFSLLMRWGDVSTSSGSVRLRSARYDPATQSVTLIPRGKLTDSASTGITVTQGHPAKTPGRPGHPSNLGQGLTDLEGNPINADTTPGRFQILVGARVQLNGETTPATTTVNEKPVRRSE